MSTAVIYIDNDEQLKKQHEQLVIIMHNLRFWTKYWNQEGGFQANERKKHWEKKADDLLTSMGMKQHNHIKAIYYLKELG